MAKNQKKKLNEMTTIFVVDDNKDIRDAIKISLQSIDDALKIVLVSSGEDCLKKLEREIPDLILMDIMMPGMDGIETTDKIKSDPDNKKIKIIYLTAKTDPLTRGIGKLRGDDFIEKPFDASDLSKRIRIVLSGVRIAKGCP